jgi:hypothetical protein
MGPPGTSLANLSMALEKLSAPAPERRPNTSLGFNDRGGLSTDSEDDPGTETGAGMVPRPSAIKRTSSSMSVESSASQPGAKRHQSLSSGTAPFSRPPNSAASSSLSAFKTSSSSTTGASGKPASGSHNAFGLGGPPKKPLFGVGSGHGGAKLMGARAGMRASRAPALAMVEASPIKGAGDTDGGQDLAEEQLPAPAFADEDVEMEAVATPERAPDGASVLANGNSRGWKGRVSLASQALTQSLADMPLTPPAQPPPTHSRATRSRTAMGPPAVPGAGSAESSPAGSSADAGRHVARRAGPAPAGDVNLGVLKACTVFVDVRTDEGDDAGGLFAEMLQGMGARVRIA